MKLFLFTLIYVLFIWLCVFCGYSCYILLKKIRQHTAEINALDTMLYKNLRELQFKTREITKFSNTYASYKSSMLVETFYTVLITFLPFKKLKSALFLEKLYKKIFK